jgi:hypothetical protein
MAYTSPSAPRSGIMIKLPPRSEPALPMEETVMSICWPGLANGGRSACTMTAATFLSCGLVLAGMVTPKRTSMFLMLWMVNGAWLVWSPVPSRPTTSP